ncbi:MAG: C10 family peptidase, partial [Bacteroidales bacterium]|nr:C10 family peptidase [Bacteroidales bacterium]
SCVATAMAQVMKYWNFPTTGMGIHTSTNTTYGTLTADFGHTSYPWDKMAATNPATTDTNIALLMYHCGVALNMKYGINESLAGTLGFINDYYFQQGNTDVPTALNNFFKYDSAQGYYRDSCTEAAWITMLKAELDLSRPIVYAGTSASGSGHAFICDGYDNSNNFHMNWGWGGTADGYFALSALNPGSLGVGGGTGGYNTRQRAIMHIIPGDTSTMLYNLQLNSNLSISDTIIKSKSPFTISVQVANIGEGDFNGSFAIALYDSLYHFACYLGEKNNQYIPSMGQDTLLFSMERNYSKYVHSYIAVLHYKSGSLFWKPIDKGLYTNAVKFTIIPQDSAPDMYLSSKMTITPTTVYKDSAFSITAQYSNRGTLPFIGKYAMAVFDSNNQNMGFVGDTNNAYLTNGYSIIKTFTTKGMNLDYGNYYAVAMCKATTDTAWQKLKTMENSYSNYLPFTVKHDVNIVEHNFDAVSISPNPTQGKIFLKRDFDGEAVVKVIDITGRVLSQQTIFTKNFEIDLHAYANGTYIVSIIDGHHIINKKVVKN